MVFLRRISDETRALVKFLHMEKKYSIREIALRAKISKSSVARYLKESNQQLVGSKTRNQIWDDRKYYPLVMLGVKLRRSHVLLRKYNANFTVKELIRFSGLQDSSASYATFYREILKAGFKFLNSRKKGVLSDCDCAKRYRFAKKCSKILKTKSDLFHSSISFYLDGVSFVFKRKPNYDASVPKGMAQRIWIGAKDRKGCG